MIKKYKLNDRLNCLERNMKIFLNQKEPREDRDITFLVLEETLYMIEKDMAGVINAKDADVYFKIRRCLMQMEKEMFEKFDDDRYEKDSDFYRIYELLTAILYYC